MRIKETGEVRKAFRLLFLNFTGTQGLYGYIYNADGSYREPNFRRLYIQNNAIERSQAQLGSFFIFEDGPQFLLQMINSILIGKSWTWVMVISPLLGASAILGRLLSKPVKSFRTVKSQLRKEL